MQDPAPEEAAARKVTFVWQQADNDPVPRPLHLVIPAALGEAVMLRSVARATQEVRDTFRLRVQWSMNALKRAEDADDPLRLGYARGELSVWRAAAEIVDSELFAEFCIWEQEEVEDKEDPELVKRFAEEIGWRQDRPEFPIPDSDDESLGLKMIMLLRDQRDQYVSLAIRFNRLARQDWQYEDGEHESPQFEESLARAGAFAMAADHMERLIAEALGVLDEYEEFVTEHGPWLERVI